MAGGHYRERHLSGLRSAVLPDRAQTGLLLYDLLQSSGKKTVKRVFPEKILGGEGSKGMNHLGDITKINGAVAPTVDCVIGGSPCQDLSIAGKRAGLSGERSGLYMEQIRIIKEMRAHDRANGRAGEFIRPRYMVWENVPGAFSSNNGKDFAAVLEEAVKIAEPEAPPVPVPKKGWPTSGCLMGAGWSVAWRVLDAQFWGVPQRRRRIALVADFGGLSAPEILFVRKSVSGYSEPGGTAGEGLAGSTESGTTFAVRIRGGCDGGGKGALVQKELSGTLGCNNDQTVFCLQGNGIDRADTAGCNGKGLTQDKCYTLNTIDRTAVCAVDCRNGTEDPDTNGTLQAKSTGGRSLNLNNVVREAMTVRRLTPLECERLQGFPDGWTDIGRWKSSKGKRRNTTDSARYKALGNSIALPPWKWVLKRLCAQYERDATMASLFDGIGGFPLLWEQLNGKGSCLWASEIEEFPMAVTIKRFGGLANE